MVDQAQHRLRLSPRSPEHEQDARRTAGPQRPVTPSSTCHVFSSFELVTLGQAEPFAALPRRAPVLRALDGRAVDGVIRGDEDRPVVLDRMETSHPGRNGLPRPRRGDGLHRGG